MKRSRNRRAGRAGDSDAGRMLVVEWFDDCAQHLSRTRSATSTTAAPAAPAVAHGVEARDRRRAMVEGRPRLDARHVEPGTPHMPGAQPDPNEQKPDDGHHDAVSR